ncbi:hypothetical protein [Crocinitomix catalasitica]|uniref:hypothetical protein n=1 Tax=Crocinitomix catalasitica TaxID=184607 RepID=UPI000485E4CE|nr:hypothetical protein [Crocinitomix catalasitica]
MGIRINKILEQINEYCLVDLTHGENRLEAKVHGKENDIKDLISVEDLIVELDYNKLLKTTLIQNFNDDDSLIKKINDHFLIKGRVINIIKTEKEFLIDIYLRTCADFILIEESLKEDLELKEGYGVEIELTDLIFYPTKN